MNPTWKDLLSLWAFWPQIILILATLGLIYGLGWRRLRQRGLGRLANGWRLTAFLSGLAVLGLAMLSAIEVLQVFLFSIHMLQHLLITMVGPPLLLLADPFPFLLWGLPVNSRRALGSLLTPKAPFRQVLRRLATPWVAWGLYVVALWIWHTPGAYDAALRYEVLHVLEHLSYFLTALLFWWHVTGAAPRLYGRLGYGFRMAYVLAALAQNEVLGVVIAFARQPLYTYYTTVPRMWGVSVLDDQALGGGIMWVPGGMMYALTAVILLARLLEQEEKKTVQGLEDYAASSEHFMP